MKTRIISGLVMAPILIILIVLGGVFLQIAIGLASVIGMKEFYMAFSKEEKGIHGIGYIFAVGYVVFIHQIMDVKGLFPLFVTVFLLALLLSMVFGHRKFSIQDVLVTFWGLFYVCFLFSTIFLIREYRGGSMFVWLPFLIAFGCDTGAYFVGVTWGKHKLIPDLSPKKTIEGAVGGVVTATILTVIFALIIGKQPVLEGVNIVLLCGLTGFLGSMLSQIGDLAASAAKRHTGIKDYGTLIPGHGGILDRFDSVLFTAPLVYYLVVFLVENIF